MNTYTTQVIKGLLFALTMAVAIQSAAGDVNKRLGKVYYKKICTVCHVETTGNAISPSIMSMNDWRIYLDKDQHDLSGKTPASVKYYMSQDYRKKIKNLNKAARKFMRFSNDKIYADLRAFVISGAKDSDTPASCD